MVSAHLLSLYLTNLPDKLQKNDLRTALYMLFSTYGPVLDVVAMKTKKMRGQAHIVFRDVQASTRAMRSLQGFDFFGKQMVSARMRANCSLGLSFAQKIQYAKGRSNVFSRLEGVYKPPTAPPNATEGQNSIFNAPLPSAVAASTTPNPRPADASTPGENGGDEAPQGVKRRRDDEDDDDEEAPMEEDDDDVSMEASSDED